MDGNNNDNGYYYNVMLMILKMITMMLIVFLPLRPPQRLKTKIAFKMFLIVEILPVQHRPKGTHFLQWEAYPTGLIRQEFLETQTFFGIAVFKLHYFLVDTLSGGI